MATEKTVRSSSSPSEVLASMAAKHQLDLSSRQFAQHLDELDPLRRFRERFDYPKKGTLPSAKVEGAEAEEDCLYFSGFGLGLKPKQTDDYVQAQLNKWGTMGTGTFSADPIPAIYCDQYGRDVIGKLVGADPKCVTFMNGLSVNLHLLLVSFYQPTKERYKLLIEADAFSSDRYVVASQAKMRGFDPKDAVLEIGPRPGEHTIRTEDILKLLEKEGSSISVVCMSGVHSHTGQKFDMEVITKAAQAQGAYVGWDLAHAVANVELQLDKWGVDFACWGTYKYLNGGPGAIGGAYLNAKHINRDLQGPLLKGWWSNKESTRFEMRQECDTAEGIDAFRISMPPVLLMAAVKASLDIIEEATLDEMLKKQFLLTGYMEMLLKKEFGRDDKDGDDDADTLSISIITPEDPNQRGSHLTLVFSSPVQKINADLKARGVVCGVRMPNSMRVSPVPLYNSFSDVYNFINLLKDVVNR